jgi:S-DNA-T family DNA segregation ATPase FtsK/SpoIIIE
MTAQEQAERVVGKLAELGVPCSLLSVTEGPQVARAELEPGDGVRMHDTRKLSRSDDLAYALGATHVRIVAPVPGRSAFAVEWDRADRRTITLDDLPDAGWPLAPTIGLDVDNKPVIAYLPDAPHILIAGQTGAGKSVQLHAILCALLRIAGPNKLRLVMVDPKRVEFASYDGLPHLAAPVASDTETAVGQLRGVVENMERRYRLLETLGARNWADGNDALARLDRDTLPYVLVVVDELADLMMTSRKEVESLIVRLAQKGRAAGVHLILATQYPTANIVTGLIRVNVPTKVCFAVPDMTASRVILDRNGAESLLGRGDGLLSFGGLPPVRFQSAYVSPEEVTETVSRWTKVSA